MKWFNTLLDPDFISKHWKPIIAIISSLMALSLILIIILVPHSNQKNANTNADVKTTALTTKTSTTKNIFRFENLKFSVPNTKDNQSSVFKSDDNLIDSYENKLLFTSSNKNLYFYDINSGTESNISNSSIFNQISNNNLYYVEPQSDFSNDLKSYDLKTGKTADIIDIDGAQLIGSVAGTGDVVYYILNNKGNYYLTAYSITSEAGKMMENFYIPVSKDTQLIQEGNKIYVINETGQYLLNVNKLEKVSDFPVQTYSKVQVWNGKTLTQSNSELYYGNQVVFKAKKLLEVEPIDETHLLINDNKNLLILDANNLKTKLLEKQVMSSTVSNGNIILSVANGANEKSGYDCYFIFKKL